MPQSKENLIKINQKPTIRLLIASLLTLAAGCQDGEAGRTVSAQALDKAINNREEAKTAIITKTPLPADQLKATDFNPITKLEQSTTTQSENEKLNKFINSATIPAEDLGTYIQESAIGDPNLKLVAVISAENNSEVNIRWYNAVGNEIADPVKVCEVGEDTPCELFYNQTKIVVEELADYLDNSAVTNPNLSLTLVLRGSTSDQVIGTWYQTVHY